MSSIEKTLYICLYHAFIGMFLCTPFATASDRGSMRVNATAPEIETFSLEGLPVSFRPTQGKILLVQIWKPENDSSVAYNKESITLYRRFHAEGLDALSVCCECSEDAAAKTAERWDIDWPQVMNEEEEPPLTDQLGVETIPCRFFVDSEGKILLLNPADEVMHASVAKLLGVSLDDVPMPVEPKETRPQSRMRPATIESREPISFQGGRLHVRDVDRANPKLLFGSIEERSKAKDTIQIFQQISLAIAHYRMDNNGEMPNWLSDLYPDYLADNVDLLCPSDPTLLRKHSHLADRNVPTSFAYEFAPLEIQGEANRTIQKRNLSQYGDKIPVVRCFKFDRPLCLTYGGEIVFLDEEWETVLPKGKTLDDPDAKVRNQLMKIAVALQQYKIKNDTVPNNLGELVPDYAPDASLFTCKATGKEFEYAFSTDKPGKEGNLREWSMAKREQYGDIVPIVRAVGVPSQDRAINLAYGGEVWESSLAWENDLTVSIDPNATTIVEVPAGNETRMQQERNWSDALLENETPIDTPNAMFPLRGEWMFQKDKKWLRMPSDITSPASILFSPLVNTGEIRVKARVNSGKEGVKIIFGYTSPNRYFKMSVGGFDNQFVCVRKWTDLNGSNVTTVSEQVPYVFPYNQWCDVRMTVDGESNTARCYVDDKLILTFNSTESLQGRLGLATWNTSADFESIVISPTITPMKKETLTSSQNKITTPPANSPKGLEEIGVIANWDTEAKGYRIFSVAWKSPAFSAGLISDDLISCINGKSFPTTGNPEEILNSLSQGPCTLTVVRQTTDTPLEITVGSNDLQRGEKPIGPPLITNLPKNVGSSGSYGGSFPQTTFPENWSSDVFKGLFEPKDEKTVLPIKGNWDIRSDRIDINQTTFSHTMLLFSPNILNGEIRFKVKKDKIDGGIYIIFGFSSIEAPYYVWQVSGEDNSITVLQKWENSSKNLEFIDLTYRAPYIVSPNKWYNIRLNVDARTRMVTGTIDRQMILECKLPDSTMGYTGIGSSNTSASFKDIEIEGK